MSSCSSYSPFYLKICNSFNRFIIGKLASIWNPFINFGFSLRLHKLIDSHFSKFHSIITLIASTTTSSNRVLCSQARNKNVTVRIVIGTTAAGRGFWAGRKSLNNAWPGLTKHNYHRIQLESGANLHFIVIPQRSLLNTAINGSGHGHGNNNNSVYRSAQRSR